MDVNSTASIHHQLNGDTANKKIKLTPFIVVPPTSSFVKLEDNNLLKGIGNLASTSLNANNSLATVRTSNSNTLTTTNSPITILNSQSTITSPLTSVNSVSSFNGQIAIANKQSGDKTNTNNSTTTTNYVMLNGLGTNQLMNQFVDNNQARNQVNSICINKLTSSAQTNGTSNPINCTNGLVSSSATSNTSSNLTNTMDSNLNNNKVSVQYLSVSYNNNSGNISITTPNNSNLVNSNGNITINSAELQQQILNTLKSASFTPTSQTTSLKTVPNIALNSNNSLNGPNNNNTTNCDQLNLDDCQLTLPSMTLSANSSINSQNHHLESTSSSIEDKQSTIQQRIVEIQNHSPLTSLTESALNDFDIKSLNNHNLLATTNRLLISPTDFLTLTEDHNNNVSSNQSSNYNCNTIRNSAVKRDVSLSSSCLSSSVELLRKSSSNYLNSLSNNFIGFERYCESPLFIDHHRDLLDDDDDLKDVNKEFINSEDLFFGTSLSDNQHLDQTQLDQLVFILDHQPPEPVATNELNSSSTLDQISQQPNNCVVILDINQQQAVNSQQSSNKVTVKSEPSNQQSQYNGNNQSSSTSSLNNGNSVLLNCLTSTNSHLLNKSSLTSSNNENLLQLTANNDSDTKLLDGIKYIIHQNACL